MNQFETTSELYKVSEKCRQDGIRIFQVESPIVLHFIGAQKRFKEHAEKLEVLDTWQPILSYMKNFHFGLTSTLLPPQAIHDLMRASDTIKTNIKRALSTTGEETSRLCKDVVEAFNLVRNDLKENPLWTCFRHHFDLETPSAFTCFKSDYMSHYKRFLTTKMCGTDLAGPEHLMPETFEIVTPSKLRGAGIYDRLIFSGSPAWLGLFGEDHVFTAPKSNELVVLCFHHLDTSLPNDSPFLGSADDDPKLYSIKSEWKNSEPEVQSTPKEATIAELTEFSLPVLNITAINNLGGSTDSDSLERVDAYLFSLSGDRLVFEDIHGSFYILETEELGGDTVCCNVRRKKASTVVQGDVLLLATGGGGDMIAPLADRILKEKRDLCRALQCEWKEELSRRIKDNSMHLVISDLKTRGVTTASAINLRNWVSPRNIAPQDSFDVLLDYLGFSTRREDFIEATKLVRRAHQSAGRHLAKKVRSSSLNASLEQLYNTGIQEFQLEGFDTTQTAFIVERRHDTTHDVSLSQLMIPIRITEDLWQ